jgi:hypothetical protein
VFQTFSSELNDLEILPDCHDTNGGGYEAKDDSPEDVVCHFGIVTDVGEFGGVEVLRSVRMQAQGEGLFCAMAPERSEADGANRWPSWARGHL